MPVSPVCADQRANVGFCAGDGIRVCFDLLSYRDELCTPGATCLDGPDGAQCECRTGYRAQDDRCLDIDECEDAPCGEHEACLNAVGGFACPCAQGFERADGACVDIDECESPWACGDTGTCSNSFGDYSCTCPPGSLVIDGGHECSDVDECEIDNGACGELACHNLLLSHGCLRSRGQLALNGGSACAVLESGAIRCWGDPAAEVVREAPTGGAYAMVSAGSDRACAVTMDGRIECWGAGEWCGDAELQGRYAWVTLGSGGCALTIDGEVRCCDESLVLPDYTYRAIAASSWELCGLDEYGDVQCTTINLEQWAFAADEYVGVSASSDSICATTRHGQAVCRGQPITLISERLLYYEGNAEHGCGITDRNEVRCVGVNQMYASTWQHQGDYVALATSTVGMCLLTSAGELECRGYYPEPPLEPLSL
jgi:hypothetical protein